MKKMVLSSTKGIISKAFVLVFFTPFMHGARFIKTDSIPESTTLKSNETTETTEKTITEAVVTSTEALVNFSAQELSSEETYTTDRNACYQCQYEQQFENTVFKILYNHSSLKNVMEDCSRCKEVDDFANNSKSLGCVCGVYTTPLASFKDVPLRTKMYHNVTCHEQVPFEEACKKICILGALSYNELEPITLCYHLTAATNVKAYVQSKSCRGDDQWAFTGLVSPTSICCEQGLPIRC